MRKFATFVAILINAFAFLAHAAPDPAPEFVREHLLPFLKNRDGLYVLRVNGKKIELLSGTAQKWLGKYQITFDENTEKAPEAAVKLETELAAYHGIPVTRIHGSLKLPVKNNGEIPSLLRSLFRADPILHPMMTPPGGAPMLAEPQLEILSQLSAYHDDARARGKATKAIVIAPTGLGKTVIAGKFAKTIIEKSNGKPYSIVFVVQNKEVLDEASSRLANILGLKGTDVKRVYGETSRELVKPGEGKLIAMSRTAMFKNLDEILEHRRKFDGNVIYVFDEAHHLGKEDGEFDAIFKGLDARSSDDDAFLGLTATPWHLDADVIKKFFENHVATAFISDEEKKEFLASKKLIYMARLMLFRAMSKGYLSPIQAYRQVSYLEESDVPMLARNFLNDWDRKFENLSEPERFALIKKEIKVHYPFIKTIIKEIRATLQYDSQKRIKNWNRGIIFVPSIAHADIYAFLLSKLSPPGKEKIIAKAYHSGLSQGMRDQTMDWFKDEEKGESTDRRVALQKTKEQAHKYLIAIRTIGEGFDDPRVNHIVLAKPYSEDDFIGMRELLQNIGRAARLHYAKFAFSISDFTGDMRRLIFADLDESLINHFFVEGGERDFRDLPSVSQKMVRVTETVVDDSTLKAENFSATSVDVPIENLQNNQLAASLAPEPPPAPAAAPEVSPFDKPMPWSDFARLPGSAVLYYRDIEMPIRQALFESQISLHDLIENLMGRTSPALFSPEVSSKLRSRLTTFGGLPEVWNFPYKDCPYTIAHFKLLKNLDSLSDPKVQAKLPPPAVILMSTAEEKFYQRMTWGEFWRRPGSAVLFHKDVELPIRKVLFEKQLSFKEVMLNGEQWFTPAQRRILSDQRLKLGVVSEEMPSPFAPAHFLLLKTRPERLWDWGLDPGQISVGGGINVSTTQFPEAPIGAPVSELMNFLKVRGFISQVQPSPISTPPLLETLAAEKAAHFYGKMQWNDFAERDGSAVIYFHDIDMAIRVQLFKTQWSLSYVMNNLNRFTPENREVLRKRFSERGLSVDKLESNTAFSPYAPAHFLLLKTRLNRIENWDLDPADISVGGDINVSTSQFPEAPIGAPVKDLMDFLKPMRLKNPSQLQAEQAQRDIIYRPLTWRQLLDEYETLELLFGSENSSRGDRGLLRSHEIPISRFISTEEAELLRYPNFGRRKYQRLKELIKKAGLEVYPLGRAQLERESLNSESPYSLAHFALVSWGGKTLIEELNRLYKKRDFEQLRRDIKSMAPWFSKFDIEEGSWLQELSSYLAAHPFDHEEAQRQLRSLLQDTSSHRLTWKGFLEHPESTLILLGKDVSMRTLKCLADEKINALDLISISKARMFRIPGLGQLTYSEIQRRFAALGMQLHDQNEKQFTDSFLYSESPATIEDIAALRPFYEHGVTRPEAIVEVLKRLNISVDPVPTKLAKVDENAFLTWNQFLLMPESTAILLGHDFDPSTRSILVEQKVSIRDFTMNRIEDLHIRYLGPGRTTDIADRLNSLGIQVNSPDQLDATFLASQSPFTVKMVDSVRAIYSQFDVRANLSVGQAYRRSQALSKAIRDLNVSDDQILMSLSTCENWLAFSRLPNQ